MSFLDGHSLLFLLYLVFLYVLHCTRSVLVYLADALVYCTYCIYSNIIAPPKRCESEHFFIIAASTAVNIFIARPNNKQMPFGDFTAFFISNHIFILIMCFTSIQSTSYSILLIFISKSFMYKYTFRLNFLTFCIVFSSNLITFIHSFRCIQLPLTLVSKFPIFLIQISTTFIC